MIIVAEMCLQGCIWSVIFAGSRPYQLRPLIFITRTLVASVVQTNVVHDGLCPPSCRTKKLLRMSHWDEWQLAIGKLELGIDAY